MVDISRQLINLFGNNGYQTGRAMTFGQAGSRVIIRTANGAVNAIAGNVISGGEVSLISNGDRWFAFSQNNNLISREETTDFVRLFPSTLAAAKSLNPFGSIVVDWWNDTDIPESNEDPAYNGGGSWSSPSGGGSGGSGGTGSAGDYTGPTGSGPDDPPSEGVWPTDLDFTNYIQISGEQTVPGGTRIESYMIRSDGRIDGIYSGYRAASEFGVNPGLPLFQFFNRGFFNVTGNYSRVHFLRYQDNYMAASISDGLIFMVTSTDGGETFIPTTQTWTGEVFNGEQFEDGPPGTISYSEFAFIFRYAASNSGVLRSAYDPDLNAVVVRITRDLGETWDDYVKTIDPGISVREVTAACAGDPDYFAVSYADGYFVQADVGTTGYTNYFLISNDNGVTWSESSFPASSVLLSGYGSYVQGMTFSGTTLIALDVYGYIWRKVEGQSWENRPSPLENTSRWIAIVSGGDEILAIRLDRMAVRSSDGGDTWVSINLAD